jgi:hypothetical protein
MALEGRCCINRKSQHGQAIAELAFQLPLLMVILFGAVEIARVFYVYHALQKAVRGGAALLARSSNVEYCNNTDLTMADVRNFIVYGNLQGTGTPVVQGLTTDLIQIFPERASTDGLDVAACTCGGEAGDPDSCDVAAGGRAPDFVVVNLGSGFPLAVPFPFVSLGTFDLRVSVRMPVTGG